MGDQDGGMGTGGRPQSPTAPGKDLFCRVLGRGAEPRVEAARAQTSAQFRNRFHFFLIKQLIFNYKSEAGSPHEMSSAIYQKKSSLGRYGPEPRSKPGLGGGVGS